MARMNWDGARRKGTVKARGSVRVGGEHKGQHSKSRKKQPGITPAQASYLAKLQRDLGKRYTGNGMRRWEASVAIQKCLAELERRRNPKTVQQVADMDSALDRLAREFEQKRAA